MRLRLLLLAATSLALAAPAAAAPADDLKALADEYWALTMREYPTYASALGIKDYDDRLTDISLAAEDRRAAAWAVFLARLDRIPDAGLSPADRVNKAILRRSLSEGVEANRFGQRMMIFSNSGGWHQQIAGLSDQLTFKTRADYDNYLKRLAAYPALNAEALKISQRALDEGYTLPCVALGGFEDTITGVIPADPTKSRLYAPFAATRPATIPAAEWTALQSRARGLIDGDLRRAYAQHLAWYSGRYKPRCNKSVGASALPNGQAYYAYKIRNQTTTALTADQIHQLGLSEVARIRAEMEQVAKKAGFASRETMIADLRTNPKYYAKTPEELMQATARELKKIDGKMPTLFTVLPRLPYGIREIPLEIAPGTTTAYYNPGSPENGIAGTYYVNTTKLDQRPLWEIPPLSVHEAVPGHHHQIALQQELSMPAWRRNGTFFTAFVEGWGLYSERLGIEMGLYDTPAKDMGRLSYEMWRATRLVVDTGLHAKGWPKERAVAFMTDNSALSAANIEAEVNRYIADPGQALAYKLGELKIRELRERSEKALGAKFDLRRFHDAVLGQGAVPLDTLDAQIGAWIESERQRS
ncbi:DUF885 domain-containing protein [Sphingomonas sp. LY160]|uniref:DUF885 domain-containing protein n=1 Tax=Sphingomonas sp. LY160 TaxID=3095342 RepID=UPI002ADED2B7|nr:DUF885 domain-containing protein [Sphingomonas sp. LY160]MEA1072095.1 DUF885 domain-containing protein [Sphingomonas sp. LY160]